MAKKAKILKEKSIEDRIWKMAHMNLAIRGIEADLVEGIIAMPNQLFYNVSIPVCVWFFNRKKKNPGKVLFVDAREMGMMVDRTHRELSDDLFAESHRLEASIREKLAGIGFNVK